MLKANITEEKMVETGEEVEEMNKDTEGILSIVHGELKVANTLEFFQRNPEEGCTHYELNRYTIHQATIQRSIEHPDLKDPDRSLSKAEKLLNRCKSIGTQNATSFEIGWGSEVMDGERAVKELLQNLRDEVVQRNYILSNEQRTMEGLRIEKQTFEKSFKGVKHPGSIEVIMNDEYVLAVIVVRPVTKDGKIATELELTNFGPEQVNRNVLKIGHSGKGKKLKYSVGRHGEGLKMAIAYFQSQGYDMSFESMSGKQPISVDGVHDVYEDDEEPMYGRVGESWKVKTVGESVITSVYPKRMCQKSYPGLESGPVDSSWNVDRFSVLLTCHDPKDKLLQSVSFDSYLLPLSHRELMQKCKLCPSQKFAQKHGTIILDSNFSDFERNFDNVDSKVDLEDDSDDSFEVDENGEVVDYASKVHVLNKNHGGRIYVKNFFMFQMKSMVLGSYDFQELAMGRDRREVPHDQLMNPIRNIVEDAVALHCLDPSNEYAQKVLLKWGIMVFGKLAYPKQYLMDRSIVCNVVDNEDNVIRAPMNDTVTESIEYQLTKKLSVEAIRALCISLKKDLVPVCSSSDSGKALRLLQGKLSFMNKIPFEVGALYDVLVKSKHFVTAEELLQKAEAQLWESKRLSNFDEKEFREMILRACKSCFIENCEEIEIRLVNDAEILIESVIQCDNIADGKRRILINMAMVPDFVKLDNFENDENVNTMFSIAVHLSTLVMDNLCKDMDTIQKGKVQYRMWSSSALDQKRYQVVMKQMEEMQLQHEVEREKMESEISKRVQVEKLRLQKEMEMELELELEKRRRVLDDIPHVNQVDQFDQFGQIDKVAGAKRVEPMDFDNDLGGSGFDQDDFDQEDLMESEDLDHVITKDSKKASKKVRKNVSDESSVSNSPVLNPLSLSSSPNNSDVLPKLEHNNQVDFMEKVEPKTKYYRVIIEPCPETLMQKEWKEVAFLCSFDSLWSINAQQMMMAKFDDMSSWNNISTIAEIDSDMYHFETSVECPPNEFVFAANLLPKTIFDSKNISRVACRIKQLINASEFDHDATGRTLEITL